MRMLMLRPILFSVAFAALFSGAPAFAQIAAAQTAAGAPADSPAGAAAPASAVVIAPNPSADIIANLKASGQFATFLKALDGSGLTPLLDKPGALTVFAPTDAAFAALPEGVLANLLKPENSVQLQAVVAYHIVNTKIPAVQVIGHAATPVPSVINKPITIDGLASPIKVNDADVIQAAAPASNGVIYVIDRVLTAPQ
jgi:uncharacterized surface protein with fasciclin (FAS1) repeats